MPWRVLLRIGDALAVCVLVAALLLVAGQAVWAVVTATAHLLQRLLTP